MLRYLFLACHIRHGTLGWCGWWCPAPYAPYPRGLPTSPTHYMPSSQVPPHFSSPQLFYTSFWRTNMIYHYITRILNKFTPVWKAERVFTPVLKAAFTNAQRSDPSNNWSMQGPGLNVQSEALAGSTPIKWSLPLTRSQCARGANFSCRPK